MWKQQHNIARRRRRWFCCFLPFSHMQITQTISPGAVPSFWWCVPLGPSSICLIYGRNENTDSPKTAMVIPIIMSNDPNVTARHACHKQAEVTWPSALNLENKGLAEGPAPPLAAIRGPQYCLRSSKLSSRTESRRGLAPRFLQFLNRCKHHQHFFCNHWPP